MPIVRFTDRDLQEIDALAAARQEISARDDVVEKSVVEPEHRRGIIRLGVTGEYAAARLIGGHIITPDDGVIGAPADVVTVSGRYVEVKTPRRAGLNFILYGNDPEHFTADYGVLCWPAGERAIDVVGWMTREAWLAYHVVENLRVPTMLYRHAWLESMWLFPDVATSR